MSLVLKILQVLHILLFFAQGAIPSHKFWKSAGRQTHDVKIHTRGCYQESPSHYLFRIAGKKGEFWCISPDFNTKLFMDTKEMTSVCSRREDGKWG